MLPHVTTGSKADSPRIRRTCGFTTQEVNGQVAADYLALALDLCSSQSQCKGAQSTNNIHGLSVTAVEHMQVLPSLQQLLHLLDQALLPSLTHEYSIQGSTCLGMSSHGLYLSCEDSSGRYALAGIPQAAMHSCRSVLLQLVLRPTRLALDALLIAAYQDHTGSMLPCIAM